MEDGLFVTSDAIREAADRLDGPKGICQRHFEA